MSVRPASHEDLRNVFVMGYDAWGGDREVDTYIERCFRSPKYKLGSWYVMEKDGALVSSLIVYRHAFHLSPGMAGIGSVATAPEHRRRSHASELIREVLTRLRQTDGLSLVFLYADVHPDMYARLGFVALPDNLQRYKPSICMVWGERDDVHKALSTAAPDYF